MKKKKKPLDPPMSSSETRIVRCPECGKDSVYSSTNAFRPFCSERCRLLDLGSWASEDYKIPTTDNSSSEDEIPEDEEKIN